MSITFSFRLEAVSLCRPCRQIKRNSERYWTKQALPIVSQLIRKAYEVFVKTLRTKAESNDMETSFRFRT